MDTLISLIVHYWSRLQQFLAFDAAQLQDTEIVLRLVLQVLAVEGHRISRLRASPVSEAAKKSAVELDRQPSHDESSEANSDAQSDDQALIYSRVRFRPAVGV